MAADIEAGMNGWPAHATPSLLKRGASRRGRREPKRAWLVIGLNARKGPLLFLKSMPSGSSRPVDHGLQ